MVLQNFVVFEGIDGAGTTTQMNLLKERLAQKPAVFTCEPTGRETGVFLRKVLKGDIQLHPDTIARLFAADRCEHLYGKGGIVELCKSGTLVVSDRYLFSNLAYQSAECGGLLPQELNKDFPLPQFVFYFDIDPALSINRIQGRGVTEIYEKKDFLEKVRSNYRRIMQSYSGETCVVQIDASQSKEAVFEKIWAELRKLPMINS